jgi:hypothetical protein
MNYNNLAQKTNYTAGSDAFPLLPFYLTTVNIPGISFSYPEMGNRIGTALSAAGDTLKYNGLSFEMLIDEDFGIYHEFMDHIHKNINVESGTFADNTFDFWVEVTNSKGKNLFKIEFYNCRIETIGDIQLDTQDDITEYTLSIDLQFDYYKIFKGTQSVPTLSV